MKTKGESFIPDPFELTPATLAWLAKKYPQVDADETLEKFVLDAKAKGWMYANWQAGFQGIVRKGMDNGWRSIVTLKGGREFDPKWQPILQEAKKFGFREPHETEAHGPYRTAFEMWRAQPQPREQNVVPIGSLKDRLPMFAGRRRA